MSQLYLRPQQLNDAIALLSQHPNANALAGGQSLLASMKLGLTQPSHLIDLQDIAELHAIQLTSEGLWIGAMVTHAQVANSNVVQRFSPMLCQLAGGIADPQVRQVGTLGGSLANNDPAACWPAGVLSHNAVVVTTQRRIKSDAFFTGLFSTALAHNELITGVLFPEVTNACYLKFEQPASRFAMTGVAITRARNQQVRVAITGLGHGVMRWPAAEQALQNNWSVNALNDLTLDASLALSDLHASANYRAHLAAVLCRRAVATMTGESADMPALQPSSNKPASAVDAAENLQSPTSTGKPTNGIAGTHVIPSTLLQVWQALLNPDVLQLCIVGCQSMQLVAPNHYRATIKVGIGPVSATFETQVHLMPESASNDHSTSASCRLQVSGNAGALGQGQANVQVHLQQIAQGTQLVWQAQPQLQGRLAQLGNRLVEASAKGLSQQFFQRFTQHLLGEKVPTSHSHFVQPGSILALLKTWQEAMLRFFRR
jgi:CO/xanthine dehydrogenase FAD-binding subunit/carbon monoxide dehydrogenase subunit G